ncbi:hypothetical protein [Aquipuribacter sp. SD81]|uniref:hypothetical protein n=1 Tax=Aquipuribacter sp. SD81 TaxID=3127703 RepID=UPI0030160F83
MVGSTRHDLQRVALVGLLVTLPGLPLPLAHASCVGPLLGVGAAVDDTDPPATSVLPLPGAEVEVSGVWFVDGCDDTAGGCAVPVDESRPLDGVELLLEQDGRAWLPGTQDASGEDEDYRISWTVQVPADVRTGPATLRAAGAELAVEIARRR